LADEAGSKIRLSYSIVNNLDKLHDGFHRATRAIMASTGSGIPIPMHNDLINDPRAQNQTTHDEIATLWQKRNTVELEKRLRYFCSILFIFRHHEE
jgi:hypothetical protein